MVLTVISSHHLLAGVLLSGSLNLENLRVLAEPDGVFHLDR